MGKNGLKTYALLSRLPLLQSYLGKILIAAFLGTHIPLLALVLYLVLISPVELGAALRVLAM